MLSLHKNGYERPLDWSTEMAKSFAEFQAVNGHLGSYNPLPIVRF